MYKAYANSHKRAKEFNEGNLVIAYLLKGRYPKDTYHKFKSKMIGPCKFIKKIGGNAYLVDLPDDLNISPIFNVADLYDYHGFDE